MVGCLAPEKCSNNISDGEDSKIMKLPVFWLGQLWGPDTVLANIYVEQYTCEWLEPPSDPAGA